MANTLERCRENNEGSNSSAPQAIISSPEQQLETFTCQICNESSLPSERKFKNNDICNHPFCKDCIIRYIQVKVERFYASSVIKCPCPYCDFELDPLSCGLILPVKLFERWCHSLSEKAILAMDHCYCPNRECSALITNECGGHLKRSVCPSCKQSFCFDCKISWHDGFSCEESGSLRDANNVAFRVLEETNKWKQCPRCRHCVELRDGCPIILCRCGIHFCYKCGEKKNSHECACTAINYEEE